MLGLPELKIAIGGVNSAAAINRFVNDRIHYTRDRADAWQSPSVTLECGRGDCEDMALLKMAMLADLGVKSWLLLVYDKIARLHHAVALTSNLVFDLHTPKPLPIEMVPDYRPILALTRTEAWLYGKAAI